MRWPVYILAGGKSSRFGSNKAEYALDGKPLLQHVIRQAEQWASEVTVVAGDKEAYATLDCRVLADLHPGLGPLSGLEAALEDAHDEWIFIMACDTLGWQQTWTEALWSHHEKSIHAIAFKGAFWEPLGAFYHVRTLPVVSAALAKGQVSPQRLLSDCSTTAVPVPDNWHLLNNINTLTDLRAYQESTQD